MLDIERSTRRVKRPSKRATAWSRRAKLAMMAGIACQHGDWQYGWVNVHCESWSAVGALSTGAEATSTPSILSAMVMSRN
jgi:hypothetical protein